MTGPALREVPFAVWMTNVYVAFVAANLAGGVLLVLDGSGPGAGASLVLFPMLWALIGQAMTPVVLGHVVLGGPRVVSHDVVPHDVVGRGALIALCAVFAAACLARRSPVGRWASYAGVAAITIAVGADLAGWIRQGL
jgi:hypothetical protein